MPWDIGAKLEDKLIRSESPNGQYIIKSWEDAQELDGLSMFASFGHALTIRGSWAYVSVFEICIYVLMVSNLAAKYDGCLSKTAVGSVLSGKLVLFPDISFGHIVPVSFV